MEPLFVDVHDIKNCFQQQFRPLEILQEYGLTSLEYECGVVIQHDINDNLEQLKDQQKLEQQALHQNREQAIIKIKILY